MTDTHSTSETGSVRFTEGAEKQYGVQDYRAHPAIEGVEIHQLRSFNDDGGSMTEQARLTDGKHEWLPGFVARQMNYSVMEPLAIKAFHLHKRQTDVWFVPPTDKILLVLGDVREDSPSKGTVRRYVLGDGNSFLVRIPPGVAHGCKNLRTAQGSAIIYMVDVQFSVDEHCDEGRIPWDFFGPDVWEVARE